MSVVPLPSMSARRMRCVVELVRVVEPGRVVHRDLGAEAAVAQVGPVADLAVADADEVGQAVAGQVGEVDGLRAVGEDEARALLLVERLRDAAGRAEALLGQRGVPDEGVVFGDQHVGVAVAVEVDEPQVRVAQVAVQARGEGAEGLPAFGRRRARRSRASGPSRTTTSGWPSPARSMNCAPPLRATLGLRATRFERGELRLDVLAAVGARPGSG